MTYGTGEHLVQDRATRIYYWHRSLTAAEIAAIPHLSGDDRKQIQISGGRHKLPKRSTRTRDRGTAIKFARERNANWDKKFAAAAPIHLSPDDRLLFEAQGLAAPQTIGERHAMLVAARTAVAEARAEDEAHENYMEAERLENAQHVTDPLLETRQAIDVFYGHRSGTIKAGEWIIKTLSEDPLQGQSPQPTIHPAHTNVESIRREMSERSNSHISALLREFQRSRSEEGSITTKTLAEIGNAMSSLIGVAGDCRICDIDDAVVMYWISVIRQKPKRKGKWSQPSQWNSIDGPRISTTSIKKLVNLVGAVFSWAVEQRWVATNPFNKKINFKKEETEDRRPYSDEETALIFGPHFDELSPNDQWFLRIAYVTGARRSEIVGLKREDVYEEHGSTVIAFRDDGDRRRLKNAASRRRVPAPRALCDLGLMEFAQTSELIFDYPQQDPSDALGKRIANYLKNRLGLKPTDEGNPTVHGFRHTAVRRMREADFSDSAMGLLVGHSRKATTTDLYGAGMSVKKLSELMEALNYPNLR